jgi:hypothetical protein
MTRLPILGLSLLLPLSAGAETSDDMKTLALAESLVQWGRTHDSAEALAAAALMLSPQSVQPLGVEKTAEGGDGAVDNKKGTAAFSPDASAILDEAKALAKSNGDKQLAKHLSTISLVSASKGAVGGPKLVGETVLARDTDRYVLGFVAGEYAMIMLSGDGDTDLDLLLYDENLKPILSSTSLGDDEMVEWVPAWTGEYLIEVVNLGEIHNNYVLLTN